DKRLGWKKYGFHLSNLSKDNGGIYEPFTENDYMRVFLSDLDLRPSCYKCPSKGGRSGSDITLGDFWGIEHIDRSMDDDRGTSLVLINTPKGAKLYEELTIESKSEAYEDALRYNRSIERSVVKPPYRELFMSSLEKRGFEIAYNRVFSQALAAKIRRRLWLKMNK
ncbi:MAG: Coenzyme F420 hydrogenase/dehydrogenase, beta subunit C-terminal domain, partial [Duncaniella sp.]|nr:Coenzyme F420 hydrogenase/dehydrogenase, beta subunit C-terminal domain [Duncaniella sp.]